MNNSKHVVAVIGVGTIPAAETLVESIRDDIIMVTTNPGQPFIIAAPPIIPVLYSDFKSGQEKRRERRASKRKKGK